MRIQKTAVVVACEKERYFFIVLYDFHIVRYVTTPPDSSIQYDLTYYIIQFKLFYRISKKSLLNRLCSFDTYNIIDTFFLVRRLK